MLSSTRARKEELTVTTTLHWKTFCVLEVAFIGRVRAVSKGVRPLVQVLYRQGGGGGGGPLQKLYK